MALCGSDVVILPSFTAVRRRPPRSRARFQCQVSTENLGISLASGESVGAPLVEALKECGQGEEVAAFHFPGHGRGASAPPQLGNLIGKSAFQYDLPELPEMDNLHDPQAAIARAQEEAASLFGAERTWFLVNGSTCGIQAAVMSTCRPGDYLVLPRNCHMSAFSAMVLSGARPRYIQPYYDVTWGIAHGVKVEDVEAEIQAAQKSRAKVGAVLVVSPTYFGVCSPLEEIAELCHRYGIPLIVDEAHGGHFKFHSRLPRTALEQGADIAVQSTHKVLSSLTQSAMLHARGSLVSSETISKCLRSLQTSSPSYLLMASLDAARAQMSTLRGTSLFATALELASEARDCLKAIPGVVLLEKGSIGMSFEKPAMDELRVTVGIWKLGLCGTEADDFLRERCRVVAELPLSKSLTFALGTGNSKRDIQRLVKGVEAMAKARDIKPTSSGSSCSKELTWQQDYKIVLNPRDAFFAEVERLPFSDAIGRISAELLSPYPPGIPVLFPGELFSQASADFLRNAKDLRIAISGASDSSLSTVMVCK